MERRTPQDSKPVVAHNELAIVLGASRFDPAHINPDFLRYNEIVDPAWQIDPPVIIESGFSLVEYTNGLALTATNDDLRVSQTAQNLNVVETMVPNVVRRYLAASPWPVEYQYIATNMVGFISVAEEGIETRLSPLNDLALQVHFEGVTPTVQTRALYSMTDKLITMYVFEIIDESVITGLRFIANIYRGVDDDVAPSERVEFITSALEKWDSDIHDFNELACQFYFSYTQKEE